MSDDQIDRAPGESPDASAPEGAGVTTTTTEVEDFKRQLAEKHDRLLRALAEVDNVKRRTQREREEYVRYANERLIADLLPILDNFDRALGAARTAQEAAKVVEGVVLIQRELLKVLERVGVGRYSAVGERFDPNRHEATGRVVSVDQAADTVVFETAPGYTLNGRVLRPAQVLVAAAPDEDVA